MSILAQATSTPITSKAQLVEHFAAGEKPKAEWLIGCEHEKFPYRMSDLKPVSYDEPAGLRDFLYAMREFGWQSIMEGENIIGLKRGGAAISFEPGGQIELSGAPLQNLHEVGAEIDQHLLEACAAGDVFNIGFLGIGFHPTARREDIPWVPKDRYRIMRNYMPKKGTMGLDMMLRTCTTQVNLDYASEADMVRKMRIGLALQPIATALFAASPFTEGQPNGFNSYRMNVWTDTDNDRSGGIPFAFEDGFGYERYVDYALDVPMYFVYRDDKYIDCSGQSFRDFIQGKLPALPGEIPTMNDWANHLTTLFPDVRLKQYLEMRGADCGSAEMIRALPSFWVGILYDATAQDGAWDLIKDWTAEDRAILRRDVPRMGMKTEVRGTNVAAIAHRAVTLAQQGLRRRAIRLHHGADETRYLDILFNITESGDNFADQLLMQKSMSPDFSMQELFNMCRLTPPPNENEGAEDTAEI